MPASCEPLIVAIALASLASARTGRGLNFLCLAVIGLLLVDLGLRTSFGFLLSVLATLRTTALGQIVHWGRLFASPLAENFVVNRYQHLLPHYYRGRFGECHGLLNPRGWSMIQ